ncbi:MAG: FAD-dependent oxidoreductase [Coriobacteriales bacterium]|jgi:succinate dehydrogenase/fumarate reductase flavoprotein subunit|nr:FAD-dependent oxidoreductase [Coriobacteriales bacterium]
MSAFARKYLKKERAGAEGTESTEDAGGVRETKGTTPTEAGTDALSRRRFLGIGASAVAGVAAAGMIGCAPKSEAPPAGSSSSGGDSGSGASGESYDYATYPAYGPDVAGTHRWEIAPGPISADEITETAECDVLIIGAGLAGCCSALSALEKTASVINIDKNPEKVTVARGVHIAGFHTKIQKSLVEKGLLVEPNYRQVIRRWINWAQGRVKEPLLWEFGRKSGACFDWLYDKGLASGRLEALLWDGYYKGPDYTEYPVTHIFYQAGKYEETINFTFYGEGDVFGNAALVPVLYDLLDEAGGQIRWDQRSERLIRANNSGPVTGVIASNSDGVYTQYNAKSVIIATGDYAADLEMMNYYSPMIAYANDQAYYIPVGVDTGDLHKQAIWVGAALQKSEPHAAVMHLDFGAASYGFLHVNGDGNRFKNEDVNTQSKSVTKALQIKKDAYTIYDSHGLEYVKRQMDAGVGGGLQWGQLTQPVGGTYNLEAQKIVLQQEIESGLTFEANTLEELAEKIGVPADNFVATVKRYNELAVAGNDVDYGKRAEVLDPILEPPFYAGHLTANLLTMCGGLRTDIHAHVLDAKDQVIEGLYVCGSAAGEFFGAGDYPTYVPGIGHGRCVTFGRIAGINAAGGDAHKEIPSLEL